MRGGTSRLWGGTSAAREVAGPALPVDALGPPRPGSPPASAFPGPPARAPSRVLPGLLSRPPKGTGDPSSAPPSSWGTPPLLGADCVPPGTWFVFKEGKRREGHRHPLLRQQGGGARQPVPRRFRGGLFLPAPCPDTQPCPTQDRPGWPLPCLQFSSSSAVTTFLEIPTVLVTVTSQSIFRKQSAGHLLYKPRIPTSQASTFS